MEAKKDTHFEHFEEDSRWVTERLEDIKKEFEGKVFAVRKKSIIASDDNIEVLIRKLEESGENMDEVFIDSIPPKDLVFIL